MSRVTYEIECLICKEAENNGIQRAVYRGQTGCTLHKRLLEHEDDLRRGHANYGISKHFQNDHPDIDPMGNGLIKAKVLSCKVFNMERCIDEALHIEQIELENNVAVLNSKAEWGRNKLRRLIVLTD